MILNVGVGVKGNRGNIVDAFHGLAVQGFYVAKRVGKAQAGHANLVGSEPVKHEGIVRVGTVGDCDFAFAFGDGSRRVFGSGADWGHD